MHRMTEELILNVSKQVINYADILNKPNKDNNIIFQDGQLSLIKNGIVEISKVINTKDMDLQNIEYNRNPFISDDTPFSALEADRKDETTQMIWVDQYHNIDFPKIVPISPFVFLTTNRWPDVFELGKIMLYAFTARVAEDKLIDKTPYFYHDICMHYSRLNIELKYTDGRTIKNVPVKFKKQFSQYRKNLPFNEFTVEQYLCRIFKAYGPCVRDIYHMMRCYELGATVKYDFLDDLHGIDGWIYETPVYQYTNTDAAMEFAEEKQNNRHKALQKGKAILLIHCNKNANGVHVAPDDALLSAIDFAKDCNQTGIKKIIF